MNAGQLLEHLKLPSIVRATILEKSKEPDQWRPFPDAPAEEAATEYLVTVCDEVIQGVEV